LKASGAVASNEAAITALDKADLTAEKSTHAEQYEPGMVVRLDEAVMRNGKSRRVQTDYTVARVDGNRVVLRHASGDEKTWSPSRQKAAGVYQPRDMNLATGDQIIFRENSGRGDDKIINGQTATIERSDRGILARTDDGRLIEIDPNKNHSIDYAWARTVHSAQGATVDRVIVAGEASRVATAETAYVACSRERESLQIVTDNPEKLRAAWEKWADRQHARDVAQARDPEPDRLQDLRREAAAKLGREGDLALARDPEPEPERQAKRDRDALER
ncbi:MAG: hypothetical protein ACYDBH_10940, partial [Acidobacteriaceae bacterium]